MMLFLASFVWTVTIIVLALSVAYAAVDLVARLRRARVWRATHPYRLPR